MSLTYFPMPVSVSNPSAFRQAEASFIYSGVHPGSSPVGSLSADSYYHVSMISRIHSTAHRDRIFSLWGNESRLFDFPHGLFVPDFTRPLSPEECLVRGLAMSQGWLHPRNPIHLVMRYEAEISSPEAVRRVYDIIIGLVREVYARLQGTPLTALECVVNLCKVLVQNGISRGEGSKEEFLTSSLTEDPRERILECFPHTMLILAIGFELGWPLHAVLSPEHIFPRWDDGHARINFEISSRKSIVFGSDEDLLRRSPMNPASVRKGVYLKNLDSRGLMAEMLAKMSVTPSFKRERAFRYADLAVSLNPSSIFALAARGNAQDNPYLALQDYTNALKLDPHVSALYANRSNAWERGGYLADAFEDINQAIRLDPRQADYYNNRGALHKALDGWHEAIADYSRAIGLNPRHRFAYGNRAFAYLNIRRPDLAVQNYTRAIEINSDDSEYFNNRGRAYVLLGKVDEARKDFQSALDLDPQNVNARKNLANLLARRNF